MREPIRPKIKIKDVADKLKVSSATVSLALNNDPRVKESTRRRIKRASRKLNYFPNIFARGLIRQKADIITVVLPSFKNIFEDPYILSSLEGVYDAARKKGFKMLIDINTETFREKRNYLKPLIDGTSIGLVIIGGTLEETFLEEITNYNVIQIGSSQPGIDASYVTGDNKKAGKIVAKYLIAKYTDREYAVVTGPDTILNMRERKEAFIDILKKAGIKIKESNIKTAEPATEKEAVLLSKELADTEAEIIFCTGDILALGIYDGLKNNGKTPGKDVKLISIDGLKRTLNKNITTVNYPVKKMAVMATEAIMDTTKIKKELDVKLIKGETA